MTYYDLNMNSKRINNCQDPSSTQDVATKNYIDTILSGYMKHFYHIHKIYILLKTT